jgi:hypothetical protein
MTQYHIMVRYVQYYVDSGNEIKNKNFVLSPGISKNDKACIAVGSPSLRSRLLSRDESPARPPVGCAEYVYNFHMYCI